MPRFYLHFDQGGRTLPDHEGIDLPDIAALHRHTMSVARGLVAADAVSGVVDLGSTLRIVDASDAEVLRVRFADAVAFIPAEG